MCDLACRTKIIINGNNTLNMLYELCESVKSLPTDQNITTSNDLIKTLNKMEDLAGEAQALYLKGIGYSGQLPRALTP